eukprot:CAMPEP_0194124532 /NCGR_PEP_ID=MMETSP0150-20130528/58894_1 /TAXON_ID=122233 /ORGANISM="Chaetoceros debilis, Strain MM31A-1" /LENGTH=68 /DNA_ID=CAMNT_0038818291 /DNA_START=660 /DNA_END=866 /DNA_ORIENTATION=+
MPMKNEKPNRIHPRDDLDKYSGNKGVVQISIVATLSIVEKIFGNVAIDAAVTVRTNATDCADGRLRDG